MDRSQSPDRPQRVSLLSLALITAALYFGREVLIPLALALLISFILTPLVHSLQQLKLGRVPAVLIVVALVFSGVGAVAWTMARQIVDLAETLPNYEQNIRAKAASLRGGGSSVLDAAKKNVEHLQEELGVGGASSTPVPPPRLAGKRQPSQAVPVTVVDPPLSPMAVLRTAVSPLLGPLGTAGLVLIFVIFMLIRREDMRDRLLRLSGEGRLNTTTQALDEAAHRVSRYLLMQSLVNGGTGVCVGVGLLLIGVPNALLWGLLAAILRFIPYLGPWIAASLPVLISLAVFPGWLQPLLALALFLLIELISNNVVEPLLYGAETGISTIGILVAAVFWTWLWGPVGLLLATPLTVCVVVLGRYVPQFRFLNVLLGDEPPLPLEAQVYHRLLAMDPAEAGSVLESSLKGKSVAEHYDTVLIPALILAERDRHRGELTAEREDFVDTTIRDWIEELAGRSAEGEVRGLGTDIAGDKTAGRLVCVPANDRADELAGQMFAQLAGRGGTAAMLPYDLPRSEVLRRLAELGAEQVFISALAPFAYTQAREVCRDLRAHFPGLRIVVALWDLRAEAERFRRRLVAAGADEVVATLADAVKAIRLSPAKAGNSTTLSARLGQALRDPDLAPAEKMLADAEQQLPVETLAAEVLLPVMADLERDRKAGRLTRAQERLATALLRDRLVTLSEASSESHGYRALVASDPEEENEAGLLIFILLLRRAGWSIVHLAQREADDGLTEVIAAVQPHAFVFSATHPSTAAPFFSFAEILHERYPRILRAFRGAGFQPAVTVVASPGALVLPADPRAAVAALEARRTALQPPAEKAA